MPTHADAKVKEGLAFLKKFYDERATLHKERIATRNGRISNTIEFMGATAPRKSILDRNRVIADKVVTSREYRKRKRSPETHRASAVLGIDGFDAPEGRVCDKGVKVYVMKQAEEAWAETTRHQAEHAEKAAMEERAA